MHSLILAILLIIVMSQYGKLKREHDNLIELRKLDNEVIEDLQNRLKSNGLDYSIG